MIETVIGWIACIFAGVLLADFASGMIHWIIDRYCAPDAPLIGKHFVGLIHEHHCRPLALLKLSVVRNNAGFILLVSSFFAVFLALGRLNVVTIPAFVFGAFANQIHRWSHRRPRVLWPVIRALQSAGVLQSPRHHAVHHGASPDRHYCLVTNFVNPVVDALGLWVRAEKALLLIGVRPRDFVRANPTYAIAADLG